MSSENWKDQITNAKDLVKYLSTDATFLAHYMADPQKIIDSTAIPDSEKSTLKSADVGKINTLLATHLPEGSRINFSAEVAHGHDIFNCTS